MKVNREAGISDSKFSFKFEIKRLPILLHFAGTTHSTTSTPQAAKLVHQGIGLSA